jgi:hypothetical protein
VTVGDQLVQDVGVVEHGCSSVVGWFGRRARREPVGGGRATTARVGTPLDRTERSRCVVAVG